MFQKKVKSYDSKDRIKTLYDFKVMNFDRFTLLFILIEEETRDF